MHEKNTAFPSNKTPTLPDLNCTNHPVVQHSTAERGKEQRGRVRITRRGPTLAAPRPRATLAPAPTLVTARCRDGRAPWNDSGLPSSRRPAPPNTGGPKPSAARRRTPAAQPPPAAGSRAAPAAAPRGAGLAPHPPPLIDGRGRPMTPVDGGPARAADHAPRPRPGPVLPALPPPGRRLPAEEPPSANFAARPLRRAAASRAERLGMREEPLCPPLPPGGPFPSVSGLPDRGSTALSTRAGNSAAPGAAGRSPSLLSWRSPPPLPGSGTTLPGLHTRPARMEAAGARPGEEGRAGRARSAPPQTAPGLRAAPHRTAPTRLGERGGG
ncbi:translation initiation factor IF-2-like [Coturnix japonica]|uniref:translation initiation factor IF-2-like n=1 Tax=Coturnix japonica TaxID=93934 RepID=UPI000776FE99|nr:translation initiation factor IF-2-like [Coturnix japonica]